MVKIRYTELPAGLHVAVRAQGRSTVIYLLPGLTLDQRRAALARARSSGRMGQGPLLRPVALARAVTADRAVTVARNGVLAMRGHPMLLLPPLIVLVSGAIVFTLMSFVTLEVRSPDAASVAPPSDIRSQVDPDPRQTRYARTVGSGLHTPSIPSDQPWASSTPSSAATPTPPASVQPTPTLTIPTSAAPSSSSVPTPGPSPSPTPSSSASGACIKLGPLGLCVNI